MKSSPKVLVIIVTWNKKDHVLALLDSLGNLDYPRELLDIVVVDNASHDGTVEALQDRRDLHLIRNPENLGGSGGFNTGLAWAFSQPPGSYDYLWLLDNDVQVHKHALSALVELLENQDEIAVAGSTMMQLDYPWRINEMGADVDRTYGTLILHRHMHDLPAWKDIPIETLRGSDLDLVDHLSDCPPWTTVDYVAAASLLVREPVARRAGLWDDFFIHYDDVEWCLRIANAGHKIAVATNSIIWHLSALAKVPTWVLYYDNRNVLYLLEKHGVPGAITKTKHRIRLKSFYYAVIGKLDLADLHIQALRDYRQRIKGKRDIRLNECYYPIGELEDLLLRADFKKILIPWNLQLNALDLPACISRIQRQRPDLEITILTPDHAPHSPWAGRFTNHKKLFRFRPIRWIGYLNPRKKYDLILQSDYEIHPAWSWFAKRVLFVNNEHCSLRESPSPSQLARHLLSLARN
ncbi:hypothetical protein MIN45_P0338 [Methylomarinovum tepidoasis]|uniref:Glycosyltransferase 2-like domain-containing protein n=1 Tax=Methylomarinovum tepidoasis TaxID=2840183 RepID=A0AAU9C802_9GAMM|nr:glycosyltransferase family 2 protein [Methylomarinovum sp. IN45]BCX87971.1 hypothetical protein MIN45_P0338 [Methylomarinovum sp. IN45]